MLYYKRKLFNKIDKEVETSIEKFREDIESIRVQLKKKIEDYNLNLSLKIINNTLNDHRKAVRNNPFDEEKMLILGREYHKVLQESHLQKPEKMKVMYVIKDDIDHRFYNFNLQIKDFLANKLLRQGKYEASKMSDGNLDRKELDHLESLVESEVKYSTIPENWNVDNVNEEVTKSLLMMRNEYKKTKLETSKEYLNN